MFDESRVRESTRPLPTRLDPHLRVTSYILKHFLYFKIILVSSLQYITLINPICVGLGR